MKRVFEVSPAYRTDLHGWSPERWWLGVGDGLVGVSISVRTPFDLDGKVLDEPAEGQFITGHVGFPFARSVEEVAARCAKARPTIDAGTNKVNMLRPEETTCSLTTVGTCFVFYSSALGASMTNGTNAR